MLAERHRARLAMQEGEVSTRTETRRGVQRVARRLFQDEDQDQDHDQNRYRNSNRNNERGSGPPARAYPAVEDNLTNQLSEEARRDLENAKKRWNFDFENEIPLPGRWDWRKVGGSRKNGKNSDVNNEENGGEDVDDDDDEDDDWGEEKIDQREKSETEANEKAVLAMK